MVARMVRSSQSTGHDGKSVLGWIVLASLVLVSLGVPLGFLWGRFAFASSRLPGSVSADGLWFQAIPHDDRITLLVADPAARAVAVYQVDASNGNLSLRSSRDITWDLLIRDFNTQDPSPAVLEGMLERASAGGVRATAP